MTVQFSNWEARPLAHVQLKQAGSDLIHLVNMVRKLEYLGATKNQPSMRVYLSHVVSTVKDYQYIDNPNVSNKFHAADLRARRELERVLSKTPVPKPVGVQAGISRKQSKAL